MKGELAVRRRHFAVPVQWTGHRGVRFGAGATATFTAAPCHYTCYACNYRRVPCGVSGRVHAASPFFVNLCGGHVFRDGSWVQNVCFFSAVPRLDSLTVIPPPLLVCGGCCRVAAWMFLVHYDGDGFNFTLPSVPSILLCPFHCYITVPRHYVWHVFLLTFMAGLPPPHNTIYCAAFSFLPAAPARTPRRFPYAKLLQCHLLPPGKLVRFTLPLDMRHCLSRCAVLGGIVLLPLWPPRCGVTSGSSGWLLHSGNSYHAVTTDIPL